VAVGAAAVDGLLSRTVVGRRCCDICMMDGRTHSPSGLRIAAVVVEFEENQDEVVLSFVPAIACDQIDKE
jgi:hypothetical protein